MGLDEKPGGYIQCEKCGEPYGWHSQSGGTSIAVHECSKPASEDSDEFGPVTITDADLTHFRKPKPASPAREWTILKRLIKGRDEYKTSIRGPRCDEPVKVIEISALREAEAHRDNLKREYVLKVNELTALQEKLAVAEREHYEEQQRLFDANKRIVELELQSRNLDAQIQRSFHSWNEKNDHLNAALAEVEKVTGFALEYKNARDIAIAEVERLRKQIGGADA